MTLLDRYMARRTLGTLCKIIFTLVGLVVLIDILTHRQDNIIRYEIPILIVLQYYLYFVPTILFEYQAAALAMLVTGLMVLGRAAQDQEITAALAGGIGLRRIVRMPVMIALLLALSAFVFEETLGVRAALGNTEIEEKFFSRMTQDKRPGISWANLGEGWTGHILKFNRRAKTGQDVHLHLIRDDLVQDIRARRIYWDETQEQWILEDGVWCKLYPLQQWEQEVSTIRQIPAPFNETPEELFALEQPPETKTSSNLAHDLRRAEILNMPVQRYWVDYHAKFARPALCFIMIWLAIPFAIQLRRGGFAIGLGLSVAIGLAYMLLFYISMGLGYMEKLPPPAAAWIPNILFFAAGLELFRRTPT
jgi:lipopolysaccharide export system permease protein